MYWLGRLRRRARLLLRKADIEAEMDAEMRHHLALEAEEGVRAGLTPEQARHRALVAFGGLERFKEEARDRRGGRWLDDLGQDLRYAARTLRKQPGFAAVAALTLALGIGATSAIFSAVDGVLLKPLPFQHPERLVAVWSANDASGAEGFTSSPPDFRELERQSRSFDGLAAHYADEANLAGDGEPARVNVARVSARFFAVLGTPPALGRGFVGQEGVYGSHRVLVISHGLWQRRFASDPAIAGRTVVVDREPHVIIGVAPASFAFPDRRAEIWLPLAFPPGHGLDTRGNYFLQIVGRLRDGVAAAQAEDELRRIARRVSAENAGAQMTSARVVPLRDQLVGDVRSVLWLLLGAIAFVLLVACVNVANLLLARGAARRREIAIRTGLGAGRGRIVRQIVTESALLALAGGIAGVAVAFGGVELITRLGPPDLPRIDEIGVDARSLAFTALLSAVTVLAFGLLPARQLSQPGAEPRRWRRGASAPPSESLAGALQERPTASAGPSRSRAQHVLIGMQMALAVTLVVGAGLLVRSFVRVMRADPGYRVENLLTVSLSLPETVYPTAERSRAFYNELLERARTLPGVQSAAVTSAVSLAGGYWGKLISFEGRPLARSMGDVPSLGYRVVSLGYLETMGVRLRRGRDFAPTDRRGPGVVLINEAAARRFWPDDDPIGTRVWLGPPEALLGTRSPGFRFPRLEVIGIVANERFAALDAPPTPEVYQLHDQITERRLTRFLVLRSEVDPGTLAAAIRREVSAIDAYQPVGEIATVSRLVMGAMVARRFTTTLLGAFAVIALTLAAIGVYGVVAHAVAQRRRELAIRLALGAPRANLLAAAAARTLRAAAAGVALGMAGAVATARLLGGLLYEVHPADPATFGAVGVLLLAVAGVASVIPARRATRVHPAETLRTE